MREITREENKKLLVEMLQEIHDFCCDNNIRYSLAYGTLLGCIRHKGFIPWDDDIDITMPRRDFEIFAERFNQSSSKLKLVCLSNTSTYNLMVAKVINTDTLLVEDVENPFELGVYVDIFIIDYLPENYKAYVSTIKKLNNLHKKYVLKTVKTRKGRSLFKNIVIAIGHAILKSTSTRDLICKMDDIAKNASHNASKKCGALASFAYGNKEIMNSEWYKEYILSSFEDRNFYIPAGYDAILSQLYGTYMTPPPKELQVTHHANKAYWRV